LESSQKGCKYGEGRALDLPGPGDRRGLFQFDLTAAEGGGQTAPLSRVVYSLVGLAGLVLAITSSMLRTDLKVAGAAPAPGRY
jgi:hypothetical protein